MLRLWLGVAALLLGACGENASVGAVPETPSGPVRCLEDAGCRDAGWAQPDVGAEDTGADAPLDASAVDRGVALDSGAAVDAEGLDATVFDAALDAMAFDAAVDATALDAALDAAALFDEGLPVDAAPVDAWVPPATPPRGEYLYQRLPIGALGKAERVTFHPDGVDAVVLERHTAIHLLDWVTGTTRRIEAPGPGFVYWHDMAFTPEGDGALVVGARLDDGDTMGVVFWLDHAAWRAGGEAPLTELVELAQPGVTHTAIEYPWDGGAPWLLGKIDTGPGYAARLREINVAEMRFEGLFTATATRAGCEDLVFARDEFDQPAALVVCGHNGADVLYMSALGGVPTWQRPPGPHLGNTYSAAAYPGGAYALVIGNSGRKVYRFARGLVDERRAWFTRKGIWRVAFQSDGQRALVVGSAGGTPLSAAVIEYRHDAFNCPSVDNDCDLTDVSIPNFDQPPYNGDGHMLMDVAFRPGCDGGLIVGGRSDWQGSFGQLIRFQIVNGRPCH